MARKGHIMTSFLLLLSFLIHLLLIITIYHLYEKIKRDKNEQAEQFKSMLMTFTNEIRQENIKLEQKLVKKNLKQLSKKSNSTNILPHDEPEYLMDEKKYKEEFEINDQVETTFVGQVLQLLQDGKTVDEIAKQLNRGKTEVELLIKLNRERELSSRQGK